MTEHPKKIINITLTTFHIWVASILIVLTLAGTLFGAIFTIKDAYDQVNQNKKIIVNHEERIHKVEKVVNEFDTSIESIKGLKKELGAFREELRLSREEFTKLYRDFDLRKK
ncbi:MAG TPA: hypothetical protein VE912_08880 [Bacteroidales bacterium]|nr:hypothetical protein [Bacteroidales bacterium]